MLYFEASISSQLQSVNNTPDVRSSHILLEDPHLLFSRRKINCGERKCPEHHLLLALGGCLCRSSLHSDVERPTFATHIRVSGEIGILTLRILVSALTLSPDANCPRSTTQCVGSTHVLCRGMWLIPWEFDVVFIQLYTLRVMLCSSNGTLHTVLCRLTTPLLSPLPKGAKRASPLEHTQRVPLDQMLVLPSSSTMAHHQCSFKAYEHGT